MWNNVIAKKLTNIDTTCNDVIRVKKIMAETYSFSMTWLTTAMQTIPERCKVPLLPVLS
jgi:hypothetical protein